MKNEDCVEGLRSGLFRGDPSDDAFDKLLSPHERAKSKEFWSPLCVARRAARRFAEHGTRRVLDIGAGPGKFCIAAALTRPDIRFHGVEQRGGLVDTARRLTRLLRVRNLEFEAGNALSTSWVGFDGFYLFNPFAENEYDPSNTFDDTVLLSKHRLRAELLQLTTRLSGIPTGSLILTYCGLGGPIPSSFDLVSEEPVGAGPLRTWLKSRSNEAGWYHLDHFDDVLRVARATVEDGMRRTERDLSASASPSSTPLQAMYGSMMTAPSDLLGDGSA
jgi:SAM-dependent methyltransferase